MNKIKLTRNGCMYWFRLTVFAGVLFVLLFLPTWEFISVDGMTKPAPSEICCQTPDDFGLVYEDVAIDSGNGYMLSGWYIPSRNHAAVVFLHGYGANREEMLPRAAAVAKAGFGALLYDLRGHGKSGGTSRAMGWPDVADAKAALDYLETRKDVDRGKIGIVGFSVGGQIAIRIASEDERIQAVFVDDPTYTRAEDIPNMPTAKSFLMGNVVIPIDLFCISLYTGVPIPMKGTADLLPTISPRPLFFVASTKNEMTRTLQLHFFQLALNPKQFWEVGGAAHGETFALAPEEYSKRLVLFFEPLGK